MTLFALRSCKSLVTPISSRAIKAIILASMLAIGGTQTRIVADAWAGATAQVPAKVAPSLRFTNASPTLVQNTLHVVEGQTVSLCVGANSTRRIAELGVFMNSVPGMAAMTFTASACDSGSKVSKALTWTTSIGDAARYPDGIKVTLTARDYSYAVPANRVRTLRILLEDSAQPVLDALATQQNLTVGVPLNLPILATGDAVDQDTVTLSIAGTGLPETAKLGPATLLKTGPDAGKWMARFKWTPTRADYDKSHQYVISFLAQDEDPSLQGVDAPDQVDVTFNLQPPEVTDDSIKNFSVGKAAWNSNTTTLTAAGLVRFKHPFSMVSGLGVVLSTTDQPALTSAPIPVQDNGRWVANVVMDPTAASLPCQITATLVHVDASDIATNATVPAVTKAVKGISTMTCAP